MEVEVCVSIFLVRENLHNLMKTLLVAYTYHSTCNFYSSFRGCEYIQLQQSPSCWRYVLKQCVSKLKSHFTSRSSPSVIPSQSNSLKSPSLPSEPFRIIFGARFFRVVQSKLDRWRSRDEGLEKPRPHFSQV